MKAVVQDRYGPPEVLHLAELDRPVPNADEILVRVRASTVSQTDTHLRRPDPFVWRFLAGLRRPTRWPFLGVELSGEVEAVGAAVTEYKIGDAVFGHPSTWIGAHAEYVCIRQDAPLALKPPSMSFEDAAAVCDGAAQALATLRMADAREGRRIVIYGASGSLGTAAVQLARHFGAHVTAVCGTAHVELVRSLGAAEVIDYRQEDFTKRGETYDAIIDAVGKYSFRRGRRALRAGGVYVGTDGLETILFWIGTRFAGRNRVKMASAARNKADVLLLKSLIESGQFRAVIDRVYPMAEVVDAHRYVEGWHKAGNVVLTIP